MIRFKEPRCACPGRCVHWQRVVLLDEAYERAHEAYLEARRRYREHLDECVEEAA